MDVSRYLAPDLFAGKCVVVTGGAGTINRGVARGFASLGAAVALFGRTPDTLEAAAAEVRAAGGRALAVVADVEKIDTLHDGLARTRAAFGPADVLVCGAAANFPAPAEQMTADGFRKVVSVDLLGSFNACRAAFDQLRETRGNVVFVSATNALTPYVYQAHVGAAKAGIDGLMRGLALEWGKYGIRCNSVLPGPIGQTEGLSRLLTPADMEAITTYIPIGRLGTVADVAGITAFLASPLAALLTGATLVADGGQSFSGSAMLAELMMGP